MSIETAKNCRLLVIDDNESIHVDFKKILTDSSASAASVDGLAADLFGGNVTENNFPFFTVDSAFQGKDGLGKVKKATEANMPYALAFVDMRMPPGWDGLETVKRIWEVDPEIHIVFCTAYSDYSAGDILTTFGLNDRLLVLKKPFDRTEVLLMATMLNTKWHVSNANSTLTDAFIDQAFGV